MLKKLSSLLVKKRICEPHLFARKTALIQVNIAKLDTQPIIKVTREIALMIQLWRVLGGWGV